VLTKYLITRYASALTEGAPFAMFMRQWFFALVWRIAHQLLADRIQIQKILGNEKSWSSSFVSYKNKYAVSSDF